MVVPVKKIILVLLLFPIFSFCQSNPLISFSPDSVNTPSNNPINFQVSVSSITGLFAAHIVIEYDNSILTLNSISPGDFLESNPGNYDVQFMSFPPADSIADSLTIDQAILGRDSADGSGTLFNISFIPVRSGSTVVRIRSFSLRDINNNEIFAETDSALIIIASPDVNAKIFLEGPFNGTSMNKELLLPLTQPYSSSLWNYNGDEAVNENFFNENADIVDWVLLELRTGTDSNSTMGRRAAFIKNDGSIVDLDGESPVSFFVSSSSYYLVIRHRNHLAVMSSVPVSVSVSESSSLYDFTDSNSKAYGTNPMKDMDGIFGLIAGETDGDGLITGSDFNLFNPAFRSAQTGYLLYDWNMDGMVTGSDFNLFNPNFRSARISQVPD